MDNWTSAVRETGTQTYYVKHLFEMSFVCLSFSDISRNFFHQIKCNGMKSFMGLMGLDFSLG